MVKAAQRSAQGREFEPRHKQLFAFVFYAHEDLNLYIQCIYLVCTLYEQCLNKYSWRYAVRTSPVLGPALDNAMVHKLAIWYGHSS